MFSLSIKRKLLAYAKSVSPYDSGNLRYNAIKGSEWNNKSKFVITYSAKDANYIPFLEENTFAGNSTTKLNVHKKFITRTYLDLVNMLDNYYNYGVSMPRKKRFNSEELLNNDLRRYRHKKSIAEYKANREVN